MRILLTLAATIGVLSLSASSAFAAKGVKKDVDGVHHVHGVVIHVEQGKGKNGKDRLGEITVKVTHHKKKGAPAAGQPAVKPANPNPEVGAKKKKHDHKFSVSTQTKFERAKGKQRVGAAFADLHDGEHVTIIEKKGHAEEVLIHEHTKKKPA